MRDEGGEIGHGAYPKEYKRRVPALFYSLVESVENGAILINAYVKTREHRNVPDYHAESDRHQEERLPTFDNSYSDKAYPYSNHD